MIKLFLDFLPIALFFIVYKLHGLMLATQVAIAASVLQLLWLRLSTGEFPKSQLISCISILLLGGATLLLKDEIFIKWKPTAVYWLLATIFLATQFFGQQTLLQRFGADSFKLPHNIWRQLNLWWGLFFSLMGALNLYVVYHFTTDVWVNFKLFGTLGLTLGFVIVQSFYVAKHLQPITEETSSE